MKTKLHSPLATARGSRFPRSSILLASLALLAATPRAPAQSLWGNALSFDGDIDDVRI